ncbi:hypothetical protein DVH24_019059 [Malus domestica]|uniref:Uncharacterized protein n=1 Tax=Malus domestica TaxID=3750 RepID=A0A498I3Z2_MALDO|nr:hypothetical protein DVH24_019059 [Malus domestica]
MNHKRRFDKLRHGATLPTSFTGVLGEELGRKALVGDGGAVGRKGWPGWVLGVGRVGMGGDSGEEGGSVFFFL